MRNVSLYLAAAAVLLASPVLAATSEVQFQGDVSGLCTLALGITGGLGLDANGDLTSTGHAAGTLVVLSVGSNTLTLDPPVWVTPAANYTAGTSISTWPPRGSRGWASPMSPIRTRRSSRRSTRCRSASCR